MFTFLKSNQRDRIIKEAEFCVVKAVDRDEKFIIH